MKNLANCDPVEFLVQTNKIRRAAEKWLKATDIINIRKRMPTITGDEAADREAARAQAMANINAILDAVMEDHPVETAELLGLMCFIEPTDLRSHQTREIIGAFGELISCPEVIDFFISLMRLGQTDISVALARLE